MSAPNLVPPGTTGGGAPVGGSGTIGTIPKWDTTTTLNDSVITQSGSNVGIGTASPSGKLVVASTTVNGSFVHIDGSLFNGSSNNSNNVGLKFLAQNSAQASTEYGSIQMLNQVSTAGSEKGRLRFFVADSGPLNEVMSILGGNVGIGTTSPVGLLNVRAALNATNLNLTSTTEGVNSYVELRLSSGDATGIYPNRAALIRGYTAAAGTDQNELAFFTASSGAPAEAMRITYDKKVGIGTASPSRLLTLSAADATIGPAVAQTTMIRLVNTTTTLSTGAGIQFGHDNNNAQTLAQISEVLTSVANQWTGDLAISLKASSSATVLTEYVRFQSGGNVGIGTPAPGCALDVVGVIKTSGYTVTTLPAGAVGQRAYVTDALAPTYLGALVAGGAVIAPVFHNGTAWVSA